MQKIFLAKALIAGAMTVGVTTQAEVAQALTIGSSIQEFTGSNNQVNVTIKDVTGGAKFTVDVVEDPDSGFVGDLSAFWFSVQDDSMVGSLNIGDFSFTGLSSAPTVSIKQAVNGAAGALGGQNNLNGGGPGFNAQKDALDVALGFGGPGSSTGLLSQVMFTVSGKSTSDFSGQTFAARLQSTGPAPNGGGSSSKLIGSGTAPTTPIPTPALLPGLIGMGVAQLRKRNLAQEEA